MTPPTSNLPSNTNLVSLLKYINKISLWLKQTFSKGIKYRDYVAKVRPYGSLKKDLSGQYFTTVSSCETATDKNVLFDSVSPPF